MFEKNGGNFNFSYIQHLPVFLSLSTRLKAFKLTTQSWSRKLALV